MKKAAFATACAVAALLLAGPAFAGPAADRAKAHIDAIAKGDVGAIMAAYTGTATLHWVGGPLDGTYAGTEKLKELWGKFSKAQGALKASVTNLAESANPKGATVTANVVFAGQNTVKVRYVMFFRGDQLVDEIWQVDPNLAN
ncbi:nuclear transport factor 2 family protein [Reyranella sp. CPCC 100927]|uniref:nuclear transport factor 2 family protein n=1 Tax=Reyranella sp. CPCC 100927 TaxID=2599616 RepID=UPI0011B5D213|nr:nuclear transport factor 2 family protein [Reyranella sp. CPCC 100927]TWT11521.1 nuclear transport factor 2 family protein [Reyranella sp. CPCC 100927]